MTSTSYNGAPFQLHNRRKYLYPKNAFRKLLIWEIFPFYAKFTCQTSVYAKFKVMYILMFSNIDYRYVFKTSGIFA